MKIIQYVHHDIKVSVQEHLKGKHREHCLCFQECVFFIPEDRQRNCSEANELFNFDVKYNITTPVWECPKYRQRLI